MALVDIGRAFFYNFGLLGYTYVAEPNGPVISPPVTAINYQVDIMLGKGRAAGNGADAYNRYTGVFQITIRGPLVDASGNPAGTYALDEQATVLLARYKRSTTISYPATSPTTFVHCQTPYLTRLGKTDDTWYTVVVSVPWWADVSP